METLKVTIKNNKARKLMEDLKEMDWINFEEETTKPKVDFKKFQGILTKEEGEEYLRFLDEIRNEWERDI
jgi:hypothetical protein